jgi:hypothetical protein
MKTSILLLFALGGQVAASAATYNINTQADFNTYKNATFSPGDRILLKRGVTFTGKFQPAGSGTPNARIFLGAQSGTGSKPIIKGPGASQSAAIRIVDLDYWTIQGLRIENPAASDNPGSQCSGIEIGDRNLSDDLPSLSDNRFCVGITIDDCEVTNVAGINSAYSAYGASAIISFFARDLLVKNNYVHDVLGAGINIRGNFWYVSTNLPTANSLFAPGNRILNNYVLRVTNDGIMCFSSQNPEIAGNLVVDCYHNTSHSQPLVAIWVHSCDGSWIHSNEVARVKTDQDGEGVDIDKNCRGTHIIEKNYFHDCYGGNFLVAPNNSAVTAIKIRYNVFAQNDTISPGEMRIVEPKDIVEIYNNVFYHPGKTIQANMINNPKFFRNNIVVANGFGGLNSAWAAAFSHNCYQSFSGLGTSNKNNTNPQFSDPTVIGNADFSSALGARLKESSPCLNAGTFISANGQEDFFGNTWSGTSYPGGAANIGIYEGTGLAP